MKKVIFLFLVITITISCTRKVVPQTDKPKTEEVQPTKPKTAKEIKLENMASVAVGQQFPNGGVRNRDYELIRMAKYYDQLLIIDFWATWCGPCIEGMPKFHELAEKYQSDQVAFIAISIDEDFDLWRNYVENENWTNENYWLGKKMEDPLFFFLYRKIDLPDGAQIAVGVPRYVIVAPEGEIIDVEGRATRPEFEVELKKLIAKYQK